MFSTLFHPSSHALFLVFLYYYPPYRASQLRSLSGWNSLIDVRRFYNNALEREMEDSACFSPTSSGSLSGGLRPSGSVELRRVIWFLAVVDALGLFVRT
ncbi:hypothetical protein L596_012774 [Steinernema carpocapsae]|uniref:Uncharacterized protein n=1 Tax=Steinernema carpocapsae TaxID=34508 RepID=A0A4U5NY40_STECR|nr:hypothetical protein L596_012774 [Steinernema carpocapsae]